MNDRLKIKTWTNADGSVSVHLFGATYEDVAREIQRVIDDCDAGYIGAANFFGPLRVTGGFVATGSYSYEV
jgi:hypothetical protein